MIDDFIEFNTSEKVLDALTEEVLAQYNRAVTNTNSEPCGERPLRTVLRECYNQKMGIRESRDMEIIEAIGVDLHINLTDMKTSALFALLRELFADIEDTPIALIPTPIPVLPKHKEDEAVKILDTQIASGELSTVDAESLILHVKEMKRNLLKEAEQEAAEAMRKHETYMNDQLVDGGFREAMLEMLEDLTIYPFAVMLGPIPTVQPMMEWVGDKLKPKNREIQAFYRISPFDVAWSPDSTSTQKGTAFYVRRTLSRAQLLRCGRIGAEGNGYITDNIIQVLEDLGEGTLRPDWTRIENKPNVTINPHANGESIDIVTRYGTMSGRLLKECGIQGLEEVEYYETAITFIADTIIQAYILPVAGVNIRPIHTASFQRINGRIPGVSIPQKMRDVERAYMSALRGLVDNFGNSLSPIGEVDVSRIQRYLAELEFSTEIAGGSVNIVDPDATGGGRPAYYFHNIPNMSSAALSIMTYMMDLADKVTQIPASVHGQPVGTGANRTFKGMSMLYGNALKPIQAALSNIDMGVVANIGAMMYNFNMRYSDRLDIKGDAQVIARYASAALAKELKKQSALDSVQVLSQLGAVVQLNPAIMSDVVMEVIAGMGIDVSKYDQLGGAIMPPVAPQSGPATAPPQQGVDDAVGQLSPPGN